MTYTIIIPLLSCYDFRLHDLGLPQSTKYEYIRRIREQYRYLHLRFLAPLGIGQLIGFKRDKDLVAKLLKLRRQSEMRGVVPNWEFINTVSVLSGGEIFFSWHIVPGINYDDVYDFLDEAHRVTPVPIQNCVGFVEPSDENVVVLGKRLRYLLELSKKRISLRMPALVYMIIATLDKRPFIKLNELQDLFYAADARLMHELGIDINGVIKRKYVEKYYRALSEHMVVGRVHIAREKCLTRLLIVAPPECATTIYGILAARSLSTWIYHGDIVVSGTCTTPSTDTATIITKHCPEALIVYRLRTMVFPFPYEFFNPLYNKWTRDCMKTFFDVLRKMGVVLKGRR